ncbi:Dabb family protein [Bacillus thermotolerans]|uniref:Dabb family protein n=1 Tax=Bacillus thermotolerans TaxID=1221996 RepID=UPI00057D0A4C|nr:Dabb family protein [Bacillus thermotolerans]KKB33462.1 Stress responsive alpha-beta barrel domain protein Dabb [Bacillus thermotolerans]
MIEHIVLIKFSNEPTKAQVDELIERTLRLKKAIPGIIDIQQGRNFSSRSKGYEVGLTVRFTDRAALANYDPHPEHQKIVSYLREIGLADLIVVDFEIH